MMVRIDFESRAFILQWNYMRFWALAGLVCAGYLCAQTDDPPEVKNARASVDKMRVLVDAGAAPRIQLQKAEDQLADAQDAAVLRKTLYGQDLTVDRADAMRAAARRRLERREKALAEARKLVDAHVAPQESLGTFQVAIASAQKEREIAESRAHLTEELAAMAKAEEALE